MKRLFLFLATSISFYNCINVEEIKSIPKYSVYCILNPDDSKIELFLSNTYTINQSFPIDSGKYIKNAFVYIRSENNVVKLNLNEKTKKYEVQNNDFLKENETYSLQIIINQDTLEAQTIIPPKPSLIIEEALVINNEAQISISWLKNKNNESYYRLIGSVDTGRASNPFFYWDNEFGIWRTNNINSQTDIIKSPNGNFLFGESNQEVEVLITLEILDSSWFQFKNQLDALLIRDSFTKKFESPIYYESNISNAVGVFGSYSKAELNFKLKN